MLDDGNTKLLLEAGVSIKRVQQHTANLNEFAACLVTHEHKDHAQHMLQYAQRGIDVHATNGTLSKIDALHNKLKPIRYNEPFRVGTWRILPFDVQHDAIEPCGFILQSDNNYKVLFVTDTYYVKYVVPGLTHIMIECNYSVDYIDDLPKFRKQRLLRSHFELQNVKKYLASCDLSKVESIHLLHLSDTNGHAERFKSEIAELTGKRVIIAEG